jgi:hypothetical protein
LESNRRLVQVRVRVRIRGMECGQLGAGGSFCVS